ncbi:MAG: hydrogenase small subunit [Candidatus Neomarinimicrobiota bacterium]
MPKRHPSAPDSDLARYHSAELELSGVSRRDFVKFCTTMTAAMGLPFSLAAQVAKTITDPARLPIIWLHFQECTGCTETLLRATHPKVEDLVLNMISLDYSETLMVGAGHQAEAARDASIAANKGKFILVVEGSIPIKDGGVYCKVGGRTALDIVKEIAPQAAAAVAIGSCASWGGVQSSGPNPTGAVGLHEVISDIPIINIPGCPASPYNLLSTVLYFLTLKKLPELDKLGRPKFAYGRLIHEHCERRPHFDAGRFAGQLGDENHRQGYCLYKLGCKGPETHANCPSIHFGNTGSWPVGGGHPCFGCTEKGVGFTKPAFEQASVLSVTPPEIFPGIVDDKKGGITPGAAAVAGVLAGAALGAGAMMTKNLSQSDQDAGTGDNQRA